MPTVYITVPTDSAESISETLVEQRLAACVNRVPCQSTYRWDGAIHHDDEAILLAKTTADRFDDLVEYLDSAHPHDVPCIERFDEDDILDAFADWRAESVED